MKNIQKIVIAAVAFGVIGVSAYAFAHASRGQAAFATVAAVRGDVTPMVDLTGKVAPASEARVSFERSGTIARVAVTAGQAVTRGQALASLNAADGAAQLAQARAGLDAANARLQAVENGARAEDVAVSDAQVASAGSALSEARRALADKVVDAYAKADDAVRGKTDQYYSQPTGTLPTLTFFVPDVAMTADLSRRRYDLEQTLKDWKAALGNDDDVFAASADAKVRLAEVKAFLDEAALAVDGIDLRANPSLVQPTVDLWKANTSAARMNVSGALSTLTAGESAVRASENALALAETQKSLKTAGPTSTDLAAQRAAVAQAQAAVQAAEAQLAKATLRSPIDGVVSRVDIHAGELAAPGAPAISVISKDAFEIQSLASEIQVAKLHVGDAVEATLDGYGTDAVFPAEVERVDPEPVAKDGSFGYPVVLRFLSDDARIKAGMTANVHVAAESAYGVIVIPRQAVLLQEDGATVLIKRDGAFVRQGVTLGVASNDLVEVKEGLAEGDLIADFGGNR